MRCRSVSSATVLLAVIGVSVVLESCGENGNHQQGEPLWISGWAVGVGPERDPASGQYMRIRRTADGAEMVLIPAQEFSMGGPDRKWSGIRPVDLPIHRVKMSRAFYLDVDPVSRRGFASFATATKYSRRLVAGFSYRQLLWNGTIGLSDGQSSREFSDPHAITEVSRSEELPIVNVSWHDAAAYCEWVACSLPTEAQYECALRGGRTSGSDWEDAISLLRPIANVRDEAFARAFPSANSGRGGPEYVVGYDDGYAAWCPVSAFPPRGFGTRGLCGNTLCWCSDWFSPDYYQESPPIDPQGPARDPMEGRPGGMRAVRGCSFLERDMSPGRRQGIEPGLAWPDLGFRCARVCPK